MPHFIRNRPGRSAWLRILRLEDRLVPSTFTVNSLSDDGSGSGNSGTLRYCVAQANANPGDDTINIAVTGTITLAQGQLTLSDTTGTTTITGPGAYLLTIDANFASRVFLINTSVTAEISGVTVTDGNVTGGNAGGGIYNYGTLTVTNSTITDNSAGSFGGGIGDYGTLNSGSLTVTNSTITDNSAGEGGGIESMGTLTVTNCTISGNSATHYGGGIYGNGTITNCTINGNSAGGAGGGINMTSDAGRLTVTNCTVSANFAHNQGGGICNLTNNDTVNLRNSTISGNSAGYGGGMYAYIAGGIFSLLNATNTIIAGNQAPSHPDLDSGSLLTNIDNIDNLINMSAAAAGLGTLGDYGGPTETIPLLPGSPAINAGTSAGAPTTDQRGLPRYGPVDIGAFEVQAPITVSSVMVNDGNAQRSEVRSLTVTFSGPVTFNDGNANAAAAFQLQRVSDGNNVTLAAAVSSNSQNQTVVTLTFSGAETDPVSAENGGAPSLSDGRYTLTIFSANLALALNGGSDYVSPTDTLGSGPGELGLYRLFGDATGNGVVDQLDLGQFRAANNSSSGNSAYVAYLDADNSGVIDQIDLGQFRQRNNSSVFPTTPGATPMVVPAPVPSANPVPIPVAGPTLMASPISLANPAASAQPHPPAVLDSMAPVTSVDWLSAAAVRKRSSPFAVWLVGEGEV